MYEYAWVLVNLVEKSYALYASEKLAQEALPTGLQLRKQEISPRNYIFLNDEGRKFQLTCAKIEGGNRQ